MRIPEEAIVKTRYILLLSLGLIWLWTFWGDVLAGLLSGLATRDLSE